MEYFHQSKILTSFQRNVNPYSFSISTIDQVDASTLFCQYLCKAGYKIDYVWKMTEADSEHGITRGYCICEKYSIFDRNEIEKLF